MSNGTGAPFVLVNMAMSADGKIATANRAVTTFGSAADQEHLHALRATCDAIVCGARTIEETDATLGNGPDRHRRARLRRGLSASPLRVVVSGTGSISPSAAIWRDRASPVVVLTSGRVYPVKLTRLRALADQVWSSPGDELDFAAAFGWLRSRFGVGRLVCEGGGGLNDALFRAGVVDEVHLTLCPFVFGGRTAPTIADGIGFPRLADAARFSLVSSKRRGDEMFLVYRATRTAARAGLTS
jgi:riboflavin-specific deaminase-like protein